MTEETSKLAEAFLAELVASGEITEADIREIETQMAVQPPDRAIDKATTPVASEEEVKDIRAEIDDMTIPEKIKAAMLGNSTYRTILILDSNRLVQNAVLSNAQLQESEIEAFAKNKNISDGVLRTISGNRTWMKSYMLKVALVQNPKTPQDLSLKWLRFLRKNDLRKLARSKDVPNAVIVNARKRLAEAQKG